MTQDEALNIGKLRAIEEQRIKIAVATTDYEREIESLNLDFLVWLFSTKLERHD